MEYGLPTFRDSEYRRLWGWTIRSTLLPKLPLVNCTIMNYTNAAILNMLGKINDGLIMGMKDDEDCIQDTLEYMHECTMAIRAGDVIPEPNFDDEKDIDDDFDDKVMIEDFETIDEDFDDKEMMQEIIMSPRKQIEEGTSPTDVVCNEGKELLIKASTGSGVCVKSVVRA